MQHPRYTPSALLLTALCLLSASANAQNADDPAARFSGTWQAQFQAKTFLTITLQDQAGKLTGSFSHSQIHLDSSGELTAAEATAGEDPITEAQVSGDSARLTTQDASTQDITQYELKLTAANEAELRFVGIPSSMTAPKPWKLARVGTALVSNLAPSSSGAQTSSTTPSAAATPTALQKLTTAAQVFLNGQFGNNATTSSASPKTTTMASDAPANSIVDNASTTGAGPKSLPPLKLSGSPPEAALAKSLESLPRRVNDQFNNLGDMVNFAIVGNKDQVQSALTAAGWQIADTDTRESVLKGILETYQKKDYMSMPMSRLYLFGRVQDFGYEQGEAYAVVASRNHFRIWKAPFTWNGKEVWVGAGTHDIGFEKDQRNGKVTHKIDPAVDGERDHIGQTLQAAEKTQSVTYYLPSDPVKEEHNATGGGYHSDGRILVVILK